MKQPLVATLRTDKNGRTQIRHLRPDSTSAGSRLVPPPPRPEAAEWEDMLLAAAWPSDRGADEREVARRYLTSLGDADPRFPDHAKALVGVGGPAGRAATEALWIILAEGLKRHHEGQSDAAWHSWSDYAAPPRGRHMLSLAAATGTVNEECGIPDPDSWNEPVGLAWTVNADIKGSSSSDAYWRGVAAYVLADPTRKRMALLYRKERKSEAMKFALWAGAHDRIADVISAALASGSIDPEALDHLLQVRSEIEPTLRDGAL